MHGHRYRLIRESIVESINEADSTGSESVPSCPGWSVADVVRHLSGLADDWLNARLEIYASPEWTARQVEEFADAEWPALADVWAELASEFEPLLDEMSQDEAARGEAHRARALPETITTVIGSFPTRGFPGGVVTDAAQHAVDIRTALDLDPRIDTDITRACNRGLLSSIKHLWKVAELPCIEIRVTDTNERHQLGGETPAATVSLSAHELFRSLGGRRSRQQLLELDWVGEQQAVVVAADRLVVPFFAVPPSEVEPSTG